MEPPAAPPAPLPDAPAAGSPTRSVLWSMLGYVGAALALAATGIAFEESSSTARAAQDVGTVLVLLAAGWFVQRSERDIDRRMRSVLWFIALFPWMDLLTIAFGPEGADLEGKSLAAAVGAGVALLAIPLWFIERRSLQLIAAFLSVHVTLVALVWKEESLVVATVPDPNPPGIVTILVGLAAVGLGVFGLVRPRTTALVLGSLAAIVGSVVLDASVIGGPSDLGLGLALAFSLAALMLGDRLGLRAVAGVGIVGSLLTTAVLVTENVQGRSRGAVALVIGLVMLALAVFLIRRDA